ncbi:MAG: amylo-alpha-1,6-glucosidase [Planctomycetota bacterium]
MRVFIKDDPFRALSVGRPFYKRHHWPCNWIIHPDAKTSPFVLGFRKRFSLSAAQTVRIHVSADERYELFIDGQRTGRGPERGDLNSWRYETFDLDLSAGAHTIIARVWALGEIPIETLNVPRDLYGASSAGTLMPCAQMSSRPGFILAPDDLALVDVIGTGSSNWETRLLDGYAFRNDGAGAQLTGARMTIDGRRFDFDWMDTAEGWRPAVIDHPGVDGFRANDRIALHQLKPGLLPQMMNAPVSIKREAIRYADSNATDALVNVSESRNDISESFAGVLNGRDVVIPANSRQRILIDLDNYYCAYHSIDASGGKDATVRLLWAESLYEAFDRADCAVKGNRDAIDGKRFIGLGDTFICDGGDRRRFESLWWHAGRYLMVDIDVKSQPLTIHRLALNETRYPLEMESSFKSDDARLSDITPMMIRVMQACSHETYMDCPYYEQMMYVGDTRLEVLATYVMTRDDRLPKKAIRLFDESRFPNGLTQSRYPSVIRQFIPPFSLWWIGMVYDYMLWRTDTDFVKEMIPGVRAVLNYYFTLLNKEGLVTAPNGWNFMDWTRGWANGIPPEGDGGISGVINWLYVNALTYAAAIEDSAGDPAMGAYYHAKAKTAVRAMDAFYVPERGLYADNLDKTRFSEHSQSLAILSGLLTKKRIATIGKSLLAADDLSRCTIFMMHYLFETYRLLGRADKIIERMDLWFTLKADGFKTTIECPEPSRSDCHAWGAHPLYHYFATFCGVRPASPGFKTATFDPLPGALKRIDAELVHPNGMIRIKIADGRSEIEPPAGLTIERK